MRIRREQLEPFARRERLLLAERLVRLLRDEFPDALAEPDNELRQAVHQQLERADELGLHVEAHVSQFVVASWLLGRDFDTRFPEARRVLRSGDFTPEERHGWLQAWSRMLFIALEED